MRQSQKYRGPARERRKTGAALLQDAVNRAVGVACHAEASAVLVYALHERAKQFMNTVVFKENWPLAHSLPAQVAMN